MCEHRCERAHMRRNAQAPATKSHQNTAIPLRVPRGVTTKSKNMHSTSRETHSGEAFSATRAVEIHSGNDYYVTSASLLVTRALLLVTGSY